MTTMISNLPRDLMEEILSRVPLKFMRAVRLTCKNWDTASRTISERFTKMHISEATRATREGESMIISLMNYKLYLTSIVVDKVDPYTETKGKLTSLNCERQVKISKVFHCVGLLLCILHDDTITTRLVVWNPYCGQTKWIKPRYSHRSFDGHDLFGKDMFIYSLGYENKKSGGGLKFLRFIDYHRHHRAHQFFWYEIYDFDSDSWTTLDVTPYWFIPFSQRGVSLKGNTYWGAGERKFEGCNNHLICFDFTRERFGPLLPPPHSVRNQSYLTLSCVREEKLAALFQCGGTYNNELEIWITAKLEAEMVSWSKFFIIDTGPMIHGSFVIDEEKKVAIGFTNNRRTINIIGEAGYFRELLDIGERADQKCWPHVCSYVPSSVQIKEPARGINNNKRQSSLETRLFDQNMSRLVAFEKAVYPRGGRLA